MLLLAKPDEVASIMRAWKRVPGRQRLKSIQPVALLERMQHSQDSLLVAITPALRQAPELRPLLDRSEVSDPRQLRVLSVISPV